MEGVAAAISMWRLSCKRPRVILSYGFVWEQSVSIPKKFHYFFSNQSFANMKKMKGQAQKIWKYSAFFLPQNSACILSLITTLNKFKFWSHKILYYALQTELSPGPGAGSLSLAFPSLLSVLCVVYIKSPQEELKKLRRKRTSEPLCFASATPTWKDRWT